MASSNDFSWKETVTNKLMNIFEKDLDAYGRILVYLTIEENSCNDKSTITPAWRTLKLSLSSDVAFKSYAEYLAKTTKGAELDANFVKILNMVHSRMMEPSNETMALDTYQKFEIAKITNFDARGVSGFMGLAHAWGMLPVPTQKLMLELIPRIINSRQMISSIDEVVGLVNKTGGDVVMVALAAISLSYDAIMNLYRWWKGEISGKRCCKNIVDSTFTIAAGAGGGIGGAAFGSLAGPFGTLAGGIIGGIISSTIMNLLIDRLTQSLFGIPKSEALENAYNFFGVKATASNNKINTAYRKLCLKHHPDKGGKPEDFHFVQVNMGVIKAAKGELL
jgi:hypothetical protein